ncbi:hypothetical protein [Pseudomonas sp. LB3P58]
MKFFDDLIVTLAKKINRGVMAAGAGLAYVQFVALVFLLVIFGSVALSALLAQV